MTTGTNPQPEAHTWKFFRAGDFDQVALTSGADMMALDRLDQKLWVALACPVSSLHFDQRTLQLIDGNGDGRIRAPELIAAIKWAGARLRDIDELVRRPESLPLAAIDDSNPAGAAVLDAARQTLALLGKDDADSISIEESGDAVQRLTQTPFNGDGIIVEESADGESEKALIRDVIACIGSETDRADKPGVSMELLERFLADAEAALAWYRQSEADATLSPLGEGTAAAVEAVAAVRAKVNDYFTRCRLAAFDTRAAIAMNGDEAEFQRLSALCLAPDSADVAALPLAHAAPGVTLPLGSGINPAWEDPIAALCANAIVPLLGEVEALDEAQWKQVLATLAPFSEWMASGEAHATRSLGKDRLQEILDGDLPARLRALIERDLAEAPRCAATEDVDRLVRYCRNLHLLCENFVNFGDFYDEDREAIFKAGTLYIDQRSCELTLIVEDQARQATMAPLAGTYLLYCECVRRGTNETRHIVAAITNGDADNLLVGRNGVYYDRDGRDWDATVVRIVENPISMRQAFWAPYKKVVRMIEEQVAKRAAAAEAASTEKLQTAATAAANADKAAVPSAEGTKKIDVGTVAALGVAFGALATALAAIAGYVSGLLQLPFWKLCLALAALLFIISAPSLVIAWLKLRRRNLGPLMDACGWAINARARINVPFGARLTGIARLPAGSRASADDRFRQRAPMWPQLLLGVIAVCFVYSLLNDLGQLEPLIAWGRSLVE
ncbi:MAG: hypothetical protein RBT81_08590 [Gammaproteobacteria bacterium]|jgi:hypothetical protein|nr:hypothetical protein [Gammaproteobacteria bacterium]